MNQLKVNFFRVLNCIYARSKAANSEMVTVELLKAYCLPFLDDRCLSVLSVSNVGVLWPNSWTDKTKLGMEVDLGPDDIMLDGDPAPLSKRGTAPNFRPMSVLAKQLHGLRCHLVWRSTSAQTTLC